MARIAMIGAGSIVFCKTLMMDVMTVSGLEDSTFVLMDLDEAKLKKIEAFAKEIIKDNNLPTKVESTTDRTKALEGADYVIMMIQVGGLGAFEIDYKIPMEFGVDQCIGDTLSPGGIFRAIRTIPVMLDFADEMKKLCPDATMLNYVNPMSAVCWALGTVKNLKYVGLCHGVQTTMDLIGRYVDEKKEDIDFTCAGINHMGWFLELKKDGKDLYPKLREVFEKPEYYINEKVRGEVMRHYGYFMTESSGHLSEYLPWFRSSKRALDMYCDEPGFGGETGAYYGYCKMLADKFAKTDFLSIETTEIGSRSSEYGSRIIEAIELDRAFKFSGNVRNDGFITNLPNGCCCEVPVYADAMGLHPTHIGDLPAQCAALNMSNVSVQGLTVQAAMTGDPEMVMQAIALDPLTSACLTLQEARDMTAKMLEAQAKYLPAFKGKKLKSLGKIDIPENVKPVEVPLDPALAIANRFGKLAEA